jgi:DNA-binding CsgD family transcriptional regulator
MGDGESTRHARFILRIEERCISAVESLVKPPCGARRNKKRKIAMEQNGLLSKRELEVVQLLMQGKSNKLIAQALGISDRTVEFHLKNIYTKCQVRSRMELVLKLGKATGSVEIEKPGVSTVTHLAESAENRGMLKSQMDWAAAFKDGVSIFSRELEMKNLLNSWHVLAGVISAIFTGFLWVGLMRRFGHTSTSDILTWIAPLIVIWAVMGVGIGMVGKRNGKSLLKVCASAMLGAGLSPFAILPLMGLVVLPVGKLFEWLGLINRATISSEAATTLAVTAMMALWLALGFSVGVILLFVTIQRPEPGIQQLPVPDRPV